MLIGHRSHEELPFKLAKLPAAHGVHSCTLPVAKIMMNKVTKEKKETTSQYRRDEVGEYQIIVMLYLPEYDPAGQEKHLCPELVNWK